MWPSQEAQLVLVDLDVVAAREEAVEVPGEDVEVAGTAEVMEDLVASLEAADVVAESLEEVPGEAAEVMAEVAAVEREAREEAAAEARAMERPSSPPTRGCQSNQLQYPRSYTPLCLAVRKSQTILKN